MTPEKRSRLALLRANQILWAKRRKDPVWQAKRVKREDARIRACVRKLLAWYLDRPYDNQRSHQWWGIFRWNADRTRAIAMGLPTLRTRLASGIISQNGVYQGKYSTCYIRRGAAGARRLLNVLHDMQKRGEINVFRAADPDTGRLHWFASKQKALPDAT